MGREENSRPVSAQLFIRLNKVKCCKKRKKIVNAGSGYAVWDESDHD